MKSPLLMGQQCLCFVNNLGSASSVAAPNLSIERKLAKRLSFQTLSPPERLARLFLFMAT